MWVDDDARHPEWLVLFLAVFLLTVAALIVFEPSRQVGTGAFVFIFALYVFCMAKAF